MYVCMYVDRPTSTDSTDYKKASLGKGYARQYRHLANEFKVRQRKFRRKLELIAVQGHPRSLT